MKYKKDFDTFQKEYIAKYSGALKMRYYLPKSLVGKKVLDIGCGSGLDTDYIVTKKPLKIAAIDASSELIAIVKEKHLSRDIRIGDFNYLPWGEYEFDLVWSKYALQHAEDVSIPLQEAYRVLKIGGIFLLQVTHPMRTATMLDSKNYFDCGSLINYQTTDGNIITEPHHTMSDWINAITQAGFTIEKTEEIINRPMNEYKGTISPSAMIFVLKK